MAERTFRAGCRAIYGFWSAFYSPVSLQTWACTLVALPTALSRLSQSLNSRGRECLRLFFFVLCSLVSPPLLPGAIYTIK